MKTVVGVLRGGPSSEYEVSLKSGATILAELDREKYEPRDIFIDRQGNWHVHGKAMTPERALADVDVAFNVLHGEYGEDGSVQKVLDAVGVPYTGSDAFSSTVAFNKHATKEIVKNLGIKVAHGVVVEPGENLDQLALELFRSFPHPAIVKPLIGGSSVGMTVADSYHALRYGLEHALSVSPKVLVEEFIKGREATVGVIDNFRNEKTYALFPVEIVPPAKHGFFNYDAKYGGETIERVPGNFTDKEKKILTEAAKKVHEEIGAQHYSRSDFIVSKRGVYFLEINSAAAVGMTSESLFPKAVKAVGSSLKEFTDHIIQLVLHR
jgi:D-alanine-D-alanine ligase